MKKDIGLAVLFSLGVVSSGYALASKDAAGSNADHQLDYHHQSGWAFESGDSQSPINIQTNKTELMKDVGSIQLDYDDMVVDEVDNGHSIQVDDTGVATINGRKFDLQQFHFHAKSEHSIDGKYAPIEVHFVNRAQDGRLAVIAVLLNEGEENPAFQTVLTHIKKGEKALLDVPVDVEKLLPDNLSYYHYNGSLTTPPLSENVEWYVLKKPVEVSGEQIADFQKHYNSNNRNVQLLKGRKVLEHVE